MSVFRTGAGLLAARLCQPVFAFLLFGSAARILDERSFGAYVLLMSMVMLFQACANLGLVPLMTRELAKDLDHAGAYLGGAALVMIPASLLSWVLFPPVLSLIGASAETSRLGWILGASLPFTTVILAVEALFVAHGRPGSIVSQNLYENIVRVAVSLTLLFMGYGVSMLLAVYVLTRAAGACFILLRLRRLPGALPVTPSKPVARMLLKGLPLYGLMSMAAMLFFKVDIIAISALQGETMVGQYGAAYRLLALSLLLPDSFVAALFPRLSKVCADERHALPDLVPRFARLILALEIPLCLTMAGGAGLLMTLLYGQPFAATAPTLAILALILPFHTMNGLLGYLLQADGNERTALVLVLCGVAANLVLTYPLTMAFGIAGAAAGVLSATVILSLAHLRAVHRSVPGLRPLDRPWRLFIPLAAGTLCLLVPVHIFGFNPLPPLAACVLLHLLGVVERRDVDQMRALAARRRPA